MASQNDLPFLDGEALIALIQESTAEGKRVRYIPFRGISMLPMLRQGKDTVEAAPLPPRLKPMDLPIYRMPSGKIVMHRVVADKGDYYLCNGDNLCTFERIPHKDMIALVTAFTRDGKRIEITNPFYRLYCICWHYFRPLRHFLRRVRALGGRILRKLGLKK